MMRWTNAGQDYYRPVETMVGQLDPGRHLGVVAAVVVVVVVVKRSG